MSIKKIRLSAICKMKIFYKAATRLYLKDLIFTVKLEMLAGVIIAIINIRPENASRILTVF